MKSLINKHIEVINDLNILDDHHISYNKWIQLQWILGTFITIASFFVSIKCKALYQQHVICKTKWTQISSSGG